MNKSNEREVQSACWEESKEREFEFASEWSEEV